jgi:hypothetical protein
MPGGRSYSSLTKRTTTTVDPGTSGVTLTVADTSSYAVLDGKFPYTLLINWGQADQEIVNVTARPSSTTFTIQRAQDGTTGQAHPIGATVDHGVSARDYNGVPSTQLINNGGSLACTASYQDIPNLSVSLTAGATYRFTTTFYYQASGTSPQVSTGMGGTVVPSFLTYRIAVQTNVGGGGGFFTDSVLSNTSRQLPAVNALLSSNCAIVMDGQIVVGTAGTLTAQCRIGAGTINVQSGGMFILEQIA